MRYVGLAFFAFVFFAAMFGACSAMKRIDPGYAGVLVDYGAGSQSGQPVVRPLSTGSYQFLNPFTQSIAQQPVAQQTLTMVQTVQEGKIKGDDSVGCRDSTGIPLSVDVTVLWRVDPSKVGDLYLIRPGVPLENGTDNDIGSLVVRGISRNAIADACGTFNYSDLFKNRAEFTRVVSADLNGSLARYFLVLDDVQIRDFKVGEEQQKALNEKAVAEQHAAAAQFLEAQRTAEARAQIEQARGQAESIRLIQQQLAASSEYVAYLATQKWDGKLPTVTGGAIPMVTVPH